MLNRCRNKNDPKYKFYGARGIKVCDRWNSFENFYADMSEGYKKGLWIDRLNNNGNYEKENCAWKNRTEQMRNRRNSIYFKGEISVDAAKRLGLKDDGVSQRIVNGWKIEDAFTLPRYARTQV